MKPLRLSRIGQRVGRGHAIKNQPLNIRRGTAVRSSVLRDTPHARVSVSYVLEASLLNDRVQTEVRREPLVEANCTRASLRASIAQAFWAEVNAYFSFEGFVQSFELLLAGKHNAWI